MHTLTLPQKHSLAHAHTKFIPLESLINLAKLICSERLGIHHSQTDGREGFPRWEEEGERERQRVAWVGQETKVREGGQEEGREGVTERERAGQQQRYRE